MEPGRASLALAAAVRSPAAVQESSHVFTEPDEDLNLPELRSGDNLFDFIDARSQQKEVSSPISSKMPARKREFESWNAGPPPTEAQEL